MSDSTHPANAETTTGSGATLNRSATVGDPHSEGINPKSHPEITPTSRPSYFEAVFGDLRSVSLSHRILGSICIAAILVSVVYVVVQLKKEEAYQEDSSGEIASRFEYPAGQLQSELLSDTAKPPQKPGSISIEELKKEIRSLEGRIRFLAEQHGKDPLASGLIPPPLPDSASYGQLYSRLMKLELDLEKLSKDL